MDNATGPIDRRMCQNKRGLAIRVMAKCRGSVPCISWLFDFEGAGRGPRFSGAEAQSLAQAQGSLRSQVRPTSVPGANPSKLPLK